MPDITRIDFSRYRPKEGHGILLSAKRDIDDRDYASANNRANYCAFHSTWAVLALDGGYRQELCANSFADSG